MSPVAAIVSGVAPDPLDRIASRPVHKPASAWNATRSVSLTPEERDALVEVARAARKWTEILASEWCAEADPSDPDEIPPPWQQANLCGLYAALARLDKQAQP